MKDNLLLQATQPGRPTAGVGTSMSAAWGVTQSVATPAPGPRPPPASALTTPGHTHAGHAAPGARCSPHQARSFELKQPSFLVQVSSTATMAGMGTPRNMARLTCNGPW